uniref:Uncharacterized protein n=1 Tax=Arundo donax TaxID=35708 RepID=A0A0A9HLM5_ARUDO
MEVPNLLPIGDTGYFISVPIRVSMQIKCSQPKIHCRFAGIQTQKEQP